MCFVFFCVLGGGGVKLCGVLFVGVFFFFLRGLRSFCFFWLLDACVVWVFVFWFACWFLFDVCLVVVA